MMIDALESPNMTGEATRAILDKCNCFKKHENMIECQTELALRTHATITAKVILFSEVVRLIVGTDKKIFRVHKDMLCLHSCSFAARFSDPSFDEDDEDEEIALPVIKAALFADFVSYLYTGSFLRVLADISGEPGGVGASELWELGTFLKAPGFQNMRLDSFRANFKQGNTSWPHVGEIETTYPVAKKGSSLRKFAAHSMVCKNPFVVNKEGSEVFKAWKQLLVRTPDIALDMAMCAGQQWGGTMPWDDENRAMYMEKEEPLEERWDKYILSTRTKEEIKKEAEAKCVRSIIELEHLVRKK